MTTTKNIRKTAKRKSIRISSEAGVKLEEALVNIKKRNMDNPDVWESEGSFTEKAILEKIERETEKKK